MPTPQILRAEGGYMPADRRIRLAGPLVTPGFVVTSSTMSVEWRTNDATASQATPTGSDRVVVGLRFGIDATTEPASDPVSAPNTIDWLAIYQGQYRIIPRSNVNGWELRVSLLGTQAFTHPRTVPSPTRQIWIISSPVPVPGVTTWAGSSYLEVTGYQP